MDKEKIVEQTAAYIKTRLSGEGSGHDWWHVYRVWKNAVHLAEFEKADLFVVELAALLHDIADWKFNDGNDDIGPQMAKEWLEGLDVEKTVVLHVCRIIQDISFKGAGVTTSMKSIEGMIVQDADRLDAIGVIGIARAFNYGGFRNNPIYIPGDESGSPGKSTIGHFYDKLLKLKDMMNTPTGRTIAEKRHNILVNFLEQFYYEWNFIKEKS